MDVARNCRPWERSFSHSPTARISSPADDRRRVPDHRFEIAAASDLEPEHAEARVGVVEGHALDGPVDRRRAGSLRLGRHGPPAVGSERQTAASRQMSHDAVETGFSTRSRGWLEPPHAGSETVPIVSSSASRNRPAPKLPVGRRRRYTIGAPDRAGRHRGPERGQVAVMEAGMNRALVSLAAAVITLTWASSVRAQTADEVVEKHLAAVGGRAALSKVTTQVCDRAPSRSRPRAPTSAGPSRSPGRRRTSRART